MSRKTKTRRSTPSRGAAPQRFWNVGEAPRVERPLLLVCGVCGESGEYDVGTLTLDPIVAKSPDRDAMERAVGFTGYFRCTKCDAGGPWELPPETVLYVTLAAIAAASGAADVPLIIGCTATFDKKVFRYATESEAHLKTLIDHEPERAFLRVRLGNLYGQAGQNERAQTAYERAIELDPHDIEAHSMLGQLLVKTDRALEAVPNWHAVLRYARDARHVAEQLRRELVRGAIQCLLEAHAESEGQIDLLPEMPAGEMEKGRADEPEVLELREFDLGSDEDMDDLCDLFTDSPGRGGRSLFRRRSKRALDSRNDRFAAPIRRETLTVARNARCPCGSGHKYKKCCGR